MYQYQIKVARGQEEWSDMLVDGWVGGDGHHTDGTNDEHGTFDGH